MYGDIALNIVVLDDDLDRHDKFKRSAEEYNVRLLRRTTVDETIKTLQPGGFDAVFLDYDLNGKVMLPRDHPDSSSRLLRWAAELGEEERRRIARHWFVHSLNQDGAEFAMELIPEAHRCPWAWQPANFSSLISAIRP